MPTTTEEARQQLRRAMQRETRVPIARGLVARVRQTGYGLHWAALDRDGEEITAGGLSAEHALHNLRRIAGLQ